MPAMLDTAIYSASAVAACFVSLLGLERAFPLRRRTRAAWARLFLNLGVSALAFLAASLTVKPTVAWLLALSDRNAIGLMHWLDLPKAAKLAIGFLWMDLSFYYWHVANHRLAMLWRFHNVHHVDPDLDVSTGFRFHFGEVALSAGFRALQVTLFGISAWTYMAYEVVFQTGTLFHHSNLRLPIRLERALNFVIVTPRMHGIHHSQVRDEANSNYSVVFSWWDRLHRTMGLDVPQAEVKIGVPAYARPEDNRFWALITAPFRAQRPYWRQADGTESSTASRATQRRHRLAE